MRDTLKATLQQLLGCEVRDVQQLSEPDVVEEVPPSQPSKAPLSVHVCRLIGPITCPDGKEQFWVSNADRTVTIMRKPGDIMTRICVRMVPTQAPLEINHLPVDFSYNLAGADGPIDRLPDEKGCLEMCSFFLTSTREVLAEMQKRNGPTAVPAVSARVQPLINPSFEQLSLGVARKSQKTVQ